MPKSFEQWYCEQANSIEDASVIRKEGNTISDPVKEFRIKAYRYAKMYNRGPMETYSDIALFISDYLEYLAGLDIMDQYDKLNGWDDEQAKEWWEEFQKSLGIVS